MFLLTKDSMQCILTPPVLTPDAYCAQAMSFDLLTAQSFTGLTGTEPSHNSCANIKSFCLLLLNVVKRVFKYHIFLN